MCKVCQKIDFLIETMEQLQTLEEWRALLIEVLNDTQPEVVEIVKIDDMNVWCNLISILASTWFYKKHIPFNPAIQTFCACMAHEYLEKDHVIHGQKDELKGYES